MSRRGALIEYQLGWPNLEVYASLNDALLRLFTPPSGAVATPSPGRLYDLLMANDFAGLETLFGALFADKYAAEGVAIHLIGVEFSRERRTLAGFEVESSAAGPVPP